MRNRICLCFLLIFFAFGFETRAQQYDFLPSGLAAVPIAEMEKPSKPLDQVFYADGRKTTFKEAIGKVDNQEAIPTLFADKKGVYRALVISERIEIDFPAFLVNYECSVIRLAIRKATPS